MHLTIYITRQTVTTTDYETLVRSIYPNVQSISAWVWRWWNPVYGVVKISIKPKSGSNLTNSTKNNIITSLKPYNVASVRPEIVEPSITSLLLVVNAKYDKQSTAKIQKL